MFSNTFHITNTPESKRIDNLSIYAFIFLFTNLIKLKPIIGFESSKNETIYSELLFSNIFTPCVYKILGLKF